MEKIVSYLSKRTWPALLLAILGGGLYLAQSLTFAHFADLNMDEGIYLLKGWLFANGQYAPFQAYGPWTQKMPLAYLIPGYAQVLFGAGLRTGRYLSILMGILALGGAWLLVKRLAGKWPAALMVWFFALSSANILSYSQAISQSIIVCISVWAFVLILGKERYTWQILTGSVLLALLVLTRQNLTPIFALGLLYIFFEHGWKNGVLSAGISILILFIGHAIYWPDILSAWTLFPQALTPFLDHWRVMSDAIPIWQTQFNAFTFLHALFEAIRFNILGFIGVLLTVLFWPYKTRTKDLPNGKAVLFLLINYFTLFLAHALASFGPNYGYYTFSRYLAFFNFYGGLGFFLALPFLAKSSTNWLRTVTAGLCIPVLTAGIGLGAYQALNFVTTLQVPRMKEMRILPGTSDLWRLLANKFHLEYSLLEWLLPMLFGVLVGVGILIAALIINKMLAKNRTIPSFSFLAMALFCLICIILSPTHIMGGEIRQTNCPFDVIQANETVGTYLAANIAPGSLVYFHTDLPPTILLYLQDFELYPAQIDQSFTFYLGGDPDQLARLGFWNAELSNTWLQQADAVLLIDRYVAQYMQSNPFLEQFSSVEPSTTPISCRDKALFHLLLR